MANADTIKAIITNMETILTAIPLRKLDMFGGPSESLPDYTSAPVYYILYDGETPEYNHGQKPGYIEPDLKIILKWQSMSISEARNKTIEWFHTLRNALTINALNVTDLAASKLISRVTVGRPELDVQPAELLLTYTTTIRYREA